MTTTAQSRPAEPAGNADVWYRGWECGFDAEAAKWVGDPWRGYKGGCDLDAPQVSAKSWPELLNEIDEQEGVAA